MSESKKVSILICTHDRCESLKNALVSIEGLNPGGGADREVVVVDNASRDRTREVVEGFAASSGLAVKYAFEGRLGKSFALNGGIGRCEGDLVAFTDDDAIVAPDWLDRIAASIDEFDAGIVFGRVDPLWESSPPSWFSSRDHGRFALLDYGPHPFVVEDKIHAFHGVNVAIRREVLASLGGFREDKGPRGLAGGVGEDTDLFERALDAGVRVVYDPRVAVRHHIPASRCTKAYHRAKMRTGRVQYCAYVREREGNLPRIAGLPRYRYRLAAARLVEYAKYTLSGGESEQFHAELDLRRFFWLAVQSTRGPGANPG